MRQASTVNGVVITASVQDNNWFQKPSSLHTKTCGTGSAYIESTELFEYDNWGRISAYWSPLSNGQKTAQHKTVYTYHGTYGYPLTKTYYTNVSTQIQEVNSPDSTGKNIASTSIWPNRVEKARTGYGYDSYGQVMEPI